MGPENEEKHEQKWEYKTVFVANQGSDSQLYVSFIDSKPQSKVDRFKDTSVSNLESCPKWEDFANKLGAEGWDISNGFLTHTASPSWPSDTGLKFCVIFKKSSTS